MIRSIRGRVVAMVLAAQLLACAGAVGFAILYTQRALWSSFNSELRERMIRVLALVDEVENKPGEVTFDSSQLKIQDGDLFYVEDAHGHPLAGSPSWIGAGMRTRSTPSSDWTFQAGSTVYRAKSFINMPIMDQENRKIPPLRVDIYYAMPANRTQQQIGNAVRIAAGVGLLSLALSVCSTWWAVARGMRPLTRFAHQADLIEPDGALPAEPSQPIRSAELLPLDRAIRQLAARVQAAFRREREFLSDAAHELKTAVAIQKSTLQLLEQGKASEAEYRAGVARALEDTARTERLVADMLFLSSIEHTQRAQRGEDAAPATNLTGSLLLALDRLAPMAEMRSVSVVCQPASALCVTASESELSRLWTTLIENAIQHSAPGSTILIEVSASSASDCRVRIVDSGSGISPEDLPHVFERFYRSDRSRSRLTGGFGLGLSIAKAIVEKTHGSIEIQSIPQAGTSVEVHLPGSAGDCHGSNGPARPAQQP